MTMPLEQLRDNLKWFAEAYCKNKNVHNNLDFLSDMCFALGAEPNLSMRLKPRVMMPGDIGITVEEAKSDEATSCQA